MLGSNQFNLVSVARIARDKLLGSSWLLSLPAAPGIIRRTTAGGAVTSVSLA